MPKYLSGRQKRRPQDQLSDDRYQYLGLDQAEPNLSDPLVGPNPPSGSQYQLVAIPGYPGKRFWVPIGGGLIAGAISVFDEGAIVGTSNSITQLNFVGAAVTANVEVQSPSGHPGIAATVTVVPVTVGDNPPSTSSALPGELWWESDTGDLYVYYDDGNSKQWVMANAGGQGQKGDSGDKGVKGDIGPTGLTGSQGQKGEVGEKGAPSTVAGPQGDKGDTGPQGQTGDKGIKGEPSTVAGPAGDKGEKGSVGIGSTGLKGEKGSGGGAQVTVSDNPPTSPSPVQGDLWWESDTFDLHVYYNDGTSAQWVSITTSAALKGEKGDAGTGFNDKISEGNTEAEVVDTGTNGYFKVTTEGTERLRIDKDGQVGINSSIPSATLDIQDATNTTPVLLLGGGSNSNGDLAVNSGEILQSGHFDRSTNTFTERFRFGTLGALGIGGANYGTSGQVLASQGSSSPPQWVDATSGQKGQKGDTGAAGAAGDKGDKGATGGTGGTGSTGQKGQKGDTGAAGDKGATGGTGTAGTKGEPGASGDKGQKGDTGATGGTGTTGSKGEPGTGGQKGQKGNTGATGGTGTAGSKGEPGTGGQKGQKGDTGAQGDSGSQGQKGDTGSQGSGGQKGQKGDTGAQGTGGTTGAKGEPGSGGADGNDGQKGQKGEIGNISAAIPSGGIIIWSGAANNIPSGWYLCNGSNGTPDLRGKFVVGYSNTDNDFDVGDSGGSKNAIVPNHTHSFTTDGDGSHTHNLLYNHGSFGGSSGAVTPRSGNTPVTPGISGRVSTESNHTHTGSTTNPSNGESVAGKNLPPYYALCYIMKS